MKTIAFYLPQFHEIPENNEWWGNGFTEWSNVKKAKPLFSGHHQPEVPIDKNYYNLLDSKIQENQSKIALENGIDGFCYYHYWFEGKLLLEKPMENMLTNKNIKIPFCISWANESWARTWDGRENNILIKQNNNEPESAWVEHYNYLSSFFKDYRYIKKNNKPVFIIYKPQQFENIEGLMHCWNQLAISDGFDGIYWGFQHPSAFSSNKIQNIFDFGIEFEPLYTDALIEGERSNLTGFSRVMYALSHPKWGVEKLLKKIKKMPSIRDYDFVWNLILNRTPVSDKIQPGAFPSWDNTPRKGYNGIVFYEAKPEKFRNYLKKQWRRAKEVYNADFLFINAWNEWGEGAHLEPDELNKYGYLEAIKECVQNEKN